jgi:hypothetical protein
MIKYLILTILMYFILSLNIYAKLNLLIPLYSCPSDNNGEIWNSIIKSSGKVNILVIWGIICENDKYQYMLKKFKKAGIKNIAYIPTNDSKRDINEIKKEMNFYAKYPINGYFFDEVSNENKSLNYNNAIVKYAKNKVGVKLVVVNSPYAEPNFVNKILADVVIVYENSYSELKFFNIKQYSNILSSKIAMLIHTAHFYYLKKILNFVKNNIGWIFVTDKNWDMLPSYFEKEVMILHNMQK